MEVGAGQDGIRRRAGGARGKLPAASSKRGGQPKGGQKADKKAKPPQANAAEVPFSPEELVGWVAPAGGGSLAGTAAVPEPAVVALFHTLSAPDVCRRPVNVWWWVDDNHTSGGFFKASHLCGCCSTGVTNAAPRSLLRGVRRTAHACMPPPSHLPTPRRPPGLQGKVTRYLQESGEHEIDYPDEEVSSAWPPGCGEPALLLMGTPPALRVGG